MKLQKVPAKNSYTNYSNEGAESEYSKKMKIIQN